MPAIDSAEDRHAHVTPAAGGPAAPSGPASPFGLAGRLVVVVGAGSSGAGLSNGEAAARAYAAAGAIVAAIDLALPEAQRVAQVIRDEGGVAHPFTADVTREDEVAGVFAQIIREHGVPHVLHNNVGATFPGEIVDMPLAKWEAAIRLNLTSTYLSVQQVLPGMLAEGRGVITNISSLASIRATEYTYPAYSATKAAVNQLTVSLALTYADRGIRANAVLPGLIDTPLVSQLSTSEEDLAHRHAASPTGRMGSPWDVANTAVFLASDAAAYVNGVCMPVDGGLSARSV